MKIATPEKVIVKHILLYMRAIGAYGGKIKSMGVKRGRAWCFDPYLLRGVPDLLFFYKNKLFFIEVKSGRNTQSDEQKTFQNYCNSSSIDYILAYSLEDVQKIIEG